MCVYLCGCDCAYVMYFFKTAYHVFFEPVFSQGDEANKLYIILRGSVSLFVENDHNDMEYPDPKHHAVQQMQKAMQNLITTPR